MAVEISVKDWRSQRKIDQFQASQTKMLTTARTAMDRWGLSGLDENAAQERMAALMELTEMGRHELFCMSPDDVRERAIQAVVRAHTDNGRIIYIGGKSYEATRPDERQCKLPSCNILFQINAKTFHQEYCSEAHRRRGQGRG